MAVAEPSVVGRLIAAWPSAALIGSYELLMRQIRQASVRGAAEQPVTPYSAPVAVTSDDAVSYEISDERHTRLGLDGAASYEARTLGEESTEGSYDTQMEHTEEFIPDSYEEDPKRDGGWSAPGRRRRPASSLQRQAWQRAQVNRTPAGDLPSGRAIAERFGRHERWGRLVKQTGYTETSADMEKSTYRSSRRRSHFMRETHS